jgi:type IV secretory pathway VirB10-like protein
MNSRSVAIFATVVAAVVGFTLWFLGGEDAPHYTPPTPEPVKVAKPADEPAKAPQLKFTPEPVVEDKPVVATPQPAVVMTEDDRKIDEALRLYPGNTDQDHLNTAQTLINLLPSLTKDGQVEASQHISNLLPDEQWSKLNHIWRNPAFNSDVIDVFATDLMNRDDKVKLPAMLEAIRIPNHHFNEEAKTTMQIFLDEDFGDDVGKWEAAMKAYLKKAEDEEKEANAGAPGAPQ